jgi:N-acylneuraminate cytidylyltransferase
MEQIVNDTIFIIPARGGSKGLPRKNTLKLNGKPLILYTIDAARGVCADENICVSTDDVEIINLTESYGLKVPFIRPESLATDSADTWSVVKHALRFYEEKGKSYKRICLLQPTSPLRNSAHIHECFKYWHSDIEMIVSVKKSKKASVICNENEEGYLSLTLNKGAKRRQDIPDYYEYNGAIYILDTGAFKTKPVKEFTKIKKYVMSETDSVDIDNELDFKICEFILTKKTI